MKAVTLSLLLAGVSATAIASPTTVVERALTQLSPPVLVTKPQNVPTSSRNHQQKPRTFTLTPAVAAPGKDSFSSRKPASTPTGATAQRIATHLPRANKADLMAKLASKSKPADKSLLPNNISNKRPGQALHAFPDVLAKARPILHSDQAAALKVKLATRPAAKSHDLTIRKAYSRHKVLVAGDDVSNPLPIAALPFADAGNTCNFNDDYDGGCVGFGSPDVVYSFTPQTDVCVEASLCGSSYDTGIYVFEDSPSTIIACNDDNCSLQSRVKNVAMHAGHTYYVVVDGYFGDCGDYTLDVHECPPPPPPVVCPANSRPEGEPVCSDGTDDNYNGGCNSFPEVYTDIECTTETVNICGTYGTHLDSSGFPVRDTDWYRLQVNNTTNVHMCVTGQYATDLFVLDGNGGCAGIFSLGGVFTGPGETQCVDVTLTGGTYYVFVSTDDFTGVPCGSNYALSITRDACPPPPSPIPCPPGARPEGEPVCQDGVDDTFNGGCNSFPEAYTDLECSTDTIKVCGTYGTYLSSLGQTRDTDWYRINVNNTTNIHYEVTGQYPTSIFVLDGNGGCAGISVLCSNAGSAGQTIACDVTLPYGTYYLVVATSAFSGVPCGSNYVMALSRDACPPPPQPIPCPPNARLEGEPNCGTDYVDNFDGGCNSSPESYVDLECTTDTIRVCGTYGTYLFQGLQYRDTDWYRINVNNTSTLHYCVTGQFPTTIFVLDGSGGCANLGFVCGNSAGAGGTACCDVTVGPGTYYLFVGTSNFAGVPCGSNYVMELSRDACPPPPQPIPCPPNALQEGEPVCTNGYVDNYDGGCNSFPETYVDLPCTTDTLRVCGTYGDYLDDFGFQTRDTDWYRIHVNNTTTLHYCVTGQFNTQIFLLGANGGCGNLDFICSNVANPGQQACCDITVGPGTYYLFVSSQGFSGVPCGSNYVLELSRDGCPPPPQPIPCPPNALQEGEPVCSDDYVDNYDGGCNSSPEAYVDLPCSTDTIKVCGTYGDYLFQGLQYRDTDWYRFHVNATSTIHACVTGQFSTTMLVIDLNGGCSNLGFPCFNTSLPGQTICCDVTLGPGDYAIFVATSDFSGIPCGSNYVLELTRDACPPPPGPLVCPPGAIAENEPTCADEYVDNYNGGCNSDPNVFTNLPCGQDVAVCGTYGNYLFQGNQFRDTDWYQITVTQNETLTWCVEGEAPTLAAILDGSGGCSNLGVLDIQTGNTRQQFCCTANVGPGTYWLFVGTQGFSGVPCGSRYVAHLTGHNCPNQCHALAIQCPEEHAAVGFTTYSLPFSLCNVGTCADSFRVSIADLYGWGGPLHTTVFLNPGQCDTFTVNFVVPVPCDPGTVNIVKFIASAVGDPTVTDSCQTRLICTGTTPVQFSDLSAEPGRGTVDVSWQAAIEGGTVFRVFRSNLRFGDYQPVSEEIQKTSAKTYHFVDRDLKPSTEYFYKIGYLESSKWRYSEMFRVITPAAVFAINRIAPNPTSGFTRIDYEIPRGGQVNLDLFNLQGEKVRRLLDTRKEAGAGSATWDGRNDRGEILPAGAYFMRLVADGRMLTRRVVIIH